jgi:hypothetical protein
MEKMEKTAGKKYYFLYTGKKQFFINQSECKKSRKKNCIFFFTSITFYLQSPRMASPTRFDTGVSDTGATTPDDSTNRSSALVVPRSATRNFIERFTNIIKIGGAKKTYTKTITHAVIAVRKNILIRVCIEGDFSIGFPHCDTSITPTAIDEHALFKAIESANTFEETQDQLTEAREGRVWIHKKDYQYALHRKGDYKYHGGTLPMLTNNDANSVYLGYLKGGIPKSSHLAIYQQWKNLHPFTEYDTRENYIPTNNWGKQRYVNLVNLRNHALGLKKNGKCARAIAQVFETESLAREFCAFFLLFDARPQTASTDIIAPPLSISPMVRSPRASLSSSATQMEDDLTTPMAGPDLGIDIGPIYGQVQNDEERTDHSEDALSDFGSQEAQEAPVVPVAKGKEPMEEVAVIESGTVANPKRKRSADVGTSATDLSIYLTGVAIDCGVPLPKENSMIRQMGAVDIPESCFLRANFYPLIQISSRRYSDKGDHKKFFSGVHDNVEDVDKNIGGNTHYNMYATLLRDWKTCLSEISMIDAIYGYSADDLCLSGLCPSIYQAMEKVCHMICGSSTIGDMQRIFPISKTFYGSTDSPSYDRICDNPRRRGRPSTKRARTDQETLPQNLGEGDSGLSYTDTIALDLSELRDGERDVANDRFAQHAMMSLEKDILEGKDTLGKSRKKRKKRFREGEEEEDFTIGTRDIMLVKLHYDNDEELELARQKLSDGACKGSAHGSVFSVRKLESDFLCMGLGTFRRDAPLISTSMLSITYTVKKTAQTASIKFPKRTGRIIPIWLLPLVMSHCGFSDVLSFDAIQSFSPFSYWYSIVYRAVETMKQKISNPQTYFPGVDSRSLLPLVYYEKMLSFLELTQKFMESSTFYTLDSLQRELDSVRKNQDRMMVQFRSMNQIYGEVMARFGLEGDGSGGNASCGEIIAHRPLELSQEELLAQVDLMASQELPEIPEGGIGREDEMIGLLDGQDESPEDQPIIPSEGDSQGGWMGMNGSAPFTPTLFGD